MKDIVALCVLSASLVLGPGLHASAAVEDPTVRKWIVASFSNAKDYAGSPNDENTINARKSPTVVGDAWSRLQDCRNAGQSLNLNLAAAEHYLFARTIASEEGDTNLRELPQKYADWKTWLQGKGLEQLLRTTSEPVSPANANVTGWGSKGIEAGLADYQDREKKAPEAKSSSWSIKFGVLYSVATRYIPATRPCTVSIK